MGLLAAGLVHVPFNSPDRAIAWCLGFPERAYNFGVVSPGRIYRSGAPDDRFVRYVHERYGVSRIISLNGSAGYAATAEELGIALTRYHWSYRKLPPIEELRSVLRALDEEGAVLVHCTHGQDRTGLVVAAHRIHRMGWTVEAAFAEMGRYGHDASAPGDYQAFLRAQREVQGVGSLLR